MKIPFTSNRFILPAFAAALVSGCAGSQQPLATIDYVDLDRFMGDWYVVAHIPTRPERRAYDALEQYTLRDDGRIDIRFSFCQGAHDGKRETMEMLGWVHDRTTNAEWRVRPFWPLRLGYQVLELDPDYSLTVIGHPSLRYAWVMARDPAVDPDTLAGVTARLTERGFDTSRLREVPHAPDSCRG